MLSVLLPLFLACNPQPTPYVPGVVKTEGKTIATVNGVDLNDGVIELILKDVPEAQRAMLMAGPQFAQFQEELINEEVMYQEAIKAGIHNDADTQLMMHLTERKIMNDYLVRKLAEAKVTDEVINTWYEEHKLQYKKETADLFLIAVDSKEAADAAYAKLQGGADFAAVVAEYSVDPQSKASGGSLGNMELSGIPPQLSAVLNSLEENVVSEPVPMGPSFGLLKYQNKKTEFTPLETVKDDIKQQVMQEEAQNIVKELRENAKVEYPAEVKTETKSAEKSEAEAH